MYNKINNLMFEDLKNFLDSYFNQLKIRILVQGNITKDHAVSIGNLVVDNLNAGRVIDASEIEINCRQIKVGNNCLKIKSFMNNDKNTATTCYFEIGAVDTCFVMLSESYGASYS